LSAPACSSRSSRPSRGGFGIGAFEARELVKAMRGRLEVESREGLGSRFTVRLRSGRIRRDFQYIHRYPEKAGIMSDDKPKLLVVEDDPGLAGPAQVGL
jgi:hypothetical protein